MIAFLGALGERSGAGGLADARQGRDAAGQKLSAGQRVWRGATGLGEIALDAIGAKGAGKGIKAAAEEIPNVIRAGMDRADEALKALKGALGGKVDDAAKRSKHADPVTGEPSWKQYEKRFGGQQTPMTTIIDGKAVHVRLDRPPTGSTIIDFKDYNWSNPSYQKPFVQQQVAKEFAEQIQKYKTIQPNVHLQFSQEPPSWVIQAIQDAGGTFSVKP